MIVHWLRRRFSRRARCYVFPSITAPDLPIEQMPPIPEALLATGHDR